MRADKKSRFYRCTMKQNRKTCAVLFEEHEYEQVILEAYWQAEGKVKLSNNRYPFIAFTAKRPLKIRTPYLTIRCSISAGCIWEANHLKCTQLGNQVSMVKKQRLLPSMIRFLLPHFQVLFLQCLYHTPFN